MSVGPVALAFVAGVLTSLSPCVLPILPLVLSAAASERKYGAVALAAGLAISFVLVGLFVATIGYSIGLTTELFRQVAAALMVMLGAVLIFPPLQTRLALASGPIANWTDRHLSERGSGYAGQFGVGILLGAIWTPCVGPTLGAASLLAAQGRDLLQVAATMLVFGIGAALPLLIVGLLSHEALQRWRKQTLSLSHAMKAALGALLILIGTLVFAGFDKHLETVLVNASPQWLTDLTTRF
jgi:cytochrome c-type biogenesis protein